MSLVYFSNRGVVLYRPQLLYQALASHLNTFLLPDCQTPTDSPLQVTAWHDGMVLCSGHGRRLTVQAVDRLLEKILPLLSEVLDPNYNKRKTSLGRLQHA